jgi:hypothetical protein
MTRRPDDDEWAPAGRKPQLFPGVERGAPAPLYLIRRHPERPDTTVASFARGEELAKYTFKSRVLDRQVTDFIAAGGLPVGVVVLYVMKRHSRVGRTYKIDEKYIGRVLPPVIEHEPAPNLPLLAPVDKEPS